MFKSKFDKWYDNQNDATKVFLDNQRKEDNKLIIMPDYRNQTYLIEIEAKDSIYSIANIKKWYRKSRIDFLKKDFFGAIHDLKVSKYNLLNNTNMGN